MFIRSKNSLVLLRLHQDGLAQIPKQVFLRNAYGAKQLKLNVVEHDKIRHRINLDDDGVHDNCM